MKTEILEEEAKERRYLWMARAFALISVAALCANIFLLIAIFSLLPVTQIQPFYVFVADKDEQIIRMTRPSGDTLDMEKLTDFLLRQYILNRYVIGNDLTDLEMRWGADGSVRGTTAPSAYNEFLKEAKYALEKAKKEGFTRDVKIEFLTKERDLGNLEEWRGKIKFTDMAPSLEKPKEGEYIFKAQIQYYPEQSNIAWKDRLKNPLGFTVLHVGLEKADKNE